MRVRIRREVRVDAPADVVWDYVTDWPRQREWVPFTRTEVVAEPADAVGGRLRAWTGVGPLGFWDTMTLTHMERTPGDGGRCEVLHTGSVVRGEGVFAVVADGPDASRFVWMELVPLPFGRFGAMVWPLVRPLVERMVDRALGGLASRFPTRG